MDGELVDQVVGTAALIAHGQAQCSSAVAFRGA